MQVSHAVFTITCEVLSHFNKSMSHTDLYVATVA